MVPVRRVTDQFEAQVLVARLGAAGVVAQLRGAGVDTVYPMGSIEVLVPEAEVAWAEELLADVEEEPSAPTSLRRWHVVTAVVVAATLFLTVIARLLGA